MYCFKLISSHLDDDIWYIVSLLSTIRKCVCFATINVSHVICKFFVINVIFTRGGGGQHNGNSSAVS